MKSNNKPIVFLNEYRISKEKFYSLKEREMVLISVASVAATEINVFQKTYIFSSHSTNNDPVIDSLSLIQRFVLLRAWAAKLFEFAKFIEDLQIKRGDSTKYAEVVRFAKRELQILMRSPIYSLVRSIRNEVSNHYSAKAAKKNLPHVSADAELTFQLHEMHGNSWYPLGEEIMFMGRINRFTANRTTKEEKLAASDEWMQWNMKATNWVKEVHVNVSRKILFPKKPPTRRNRMYWLEEDQVRRFENIGVPLFARNPRS